MFVMLCLIGFGSVVNVGLLRKVHTLEAEKRKIPDGIWLQRLRDGTFVERNGLVWGVDNGNVIGLCAEATNLVVKTRRGATLTDSFNLPPLPSNVKTTYQDVVVKGEPPDPSPVLRAMTNWPRKVTERSR